MSLYINHPLNWSHFIWPSSLLLICKSLPSPLLLPLPPSPSIHNQFHHFSPHPLKMMMDSRLGPHLRNALLNVVNHRETNLAVTSLLAFIAIYISLAAILDHSLFHPLTFLPPPFSPPSIPSLPPLPSPPPSSASLRPFPLFLLWALSLAIGHLFRLLFLPSLLGPLLVGLLLANFPSLSSLLPPPPPHFSSFIFEFAFLLILIRSALAIDSNALRRQLALCFVLAILCPLAECLSIVVLAHFAYGVPLSAAVLFGFALAPSSPAVISPAILSLGKKEYGTESGVLTAVLSSTSLDNVFVLVAFSISLEIVSIHSDELSYTLTRIPTEILIGAIFGMIAGFFLRSFPRPDAHRAHFQRGFLLLVAGIAFHFGTRAIGCGLAGPIAVLLMTGTASMQWQMDNHRRTRMEENGLRLIWDLLAGPLLFLPLGTLLDFSSPAFSLHLLGPSLALLLLSLAVRFVASLATSFCCFGPLSGERLFLAFALLPKATLQASLLVGLLDFTNDQLGGDSAELMAQTCMLALLLCAPLGELAIRLLGPLLLRQKLLPSAGVPSGPTLVAKGAVTHSDPKDNRLRLELGPTDPVDPPNAASSLANHMRDFRRKMENSKL